jgi:hypothetical protein
MQNAVHLEDLRCDGQAHGGCQAACLLFWKEDWLRRVENNESIPTSEMTPTHSASENDDALRSLNRTTRQPGRSTDGGDVYRCQATELLKATSEVRRRDRWNPFFYVKDVTSGNVKLTQFLWYGLLAIVNAFFMHWMGRRYPNVCGRAIKETPHLELGLERGELVQVRSKQEIMETLNSSLRNRGLLYDVEMLPFSESGTFKVLDRIERIVDEKTGRLLHFKNPCIILDGVTCSGNLSMRRMFCPRAVYPYWREIWLKRVEQQGRKH